VLELGTFVDAPEWQKGLNEKVKGKQVAPSELSTSNEEGKSKSKLKYNALL